MVYGTGVDIVEVDRVAMLCEKYGEKFINRVFSEEEKVYSFAKKHTKSAMRSLSARFAAKEAFVKALGTGVIKHINLKDIHVIIDEMGKPHIELKTNIPYFDENGITRIHVTLSHCDIYAIAMVVLEK